MEISLADHLFRHQYGKMVSILTSIFGLSNLELIEDAIQDTFIKAVKTWRNQIPENPEAWLTQAAKNRAVDLFRQIKADKKRVEFLNSGASAIALNELFLDHEIEDSQLRMIFTACHPELKRQDQIAFALKTISGFGQREIAAALLLKEETVKKRLARARKVITTQNVSFSIPQGKDLNTRINGVLEVIYLTFNEGFHSNNQDKLIRDDLCAEAIRLVQLVLTNETLRFPKVYALLALMCFHGSRLDARIGDSGELLDIKNQDRKRWLLPLIKLGNAAMNKAVETNEYSTYHFEAAIAGEHIKASSFESTNWEEILRLYSSLYRLNNSEFVMLSKVIVLIQLSRFKDAKSLLESIDLEKLEQRKYLCFGTWAEYYKATSNSVQEKKYLELAIENCTNLAEKEYLISKLKI